MTATCLQFSILLVLVCVAAVWCGVVRVGVLTSPVDEALPAAGSFCSANYVKWLEQAAVRLFLFFFIGVFFFFFCLLLLFLLKSKVNCFLLFYWSISTHHITSEYLLCRMMHLTLWLTKCCRIWMACYSQEAASASTATPHTSRLQREYTMLFSLLMKRE